MPRIDFIQAELLKNCGIHCNTFRFIGQLYFLTGICLDVLKIAGIRPLFKMTQF